MGQDVSIGIGLPDGAVHQGSKVMRERRVDGERLVRLETQMTEVREKQDDQSNILIQIASEVTTIRLAQAEQRGAAKTIKVIWVAGLSLLSLIGGWLGGAVRHL